jgi:predicted RNA methylase
MTSKRHAGFDLAQAARDRSFTPRASDVPALLDLLAGDAAVEPGLGRAIVDALARVSAGDASAGRARLRETLIASLSAPEAQRRRRAAETIGRLGEHEAEDALLAAFDREREPAARRAIVGALGKVGGTRALDHLRAAAAGDDGDTVRRAVLLLERTIGRAEAGTILATVPPPSPLPIVLRCRAGLEEILADELPASWAPVVLGPGAVRATLAEPLESVFRARTMLRFGVSLPSERAGDDPEANAAAIAASITGPLALSTLRGLTAGPIRYRIDWAGGGHRRAIVYRVAELVRARTPDIVNDPTQTLWEVIVHEERSRLRVELVPRRLDDPRFRWRVRDVPAASHPTIAAALARLAAPRAGDVVWDPFVGSGGELVETALLAPGVSLLGTDTDPDALDAARANLAAANVRATLAIGDATTYTPERPPTLVLTNPPMGRRVLERSDVGPLLDRFVDRAAELLAPGGRLVWISPLPGRTHRRARQAGLRLEKAFRVDMGGFTAEAQRLRKAPDGTRGYGGGGGPGGGPSSRRRHSRSS